LIVRWTRGMAGKHIGAPFAIEPYRFIYVVSRKACRHTRGRTKACIMWPSSPGCLNCSV
jgi:hypothetical protein